MLLLGAKIQIPRSSIRQILRNLEAQVSVRKESLRNGRRIEALAMSEAKNASMEGIMTAIIAIAGAHHIVTKSSAIQAITGAHHIVTTERLYGVMTAINRPTDVMSARGPPTGAMVRGRLTDRTTDNNLTATTASTTVAATSKEIGTFLRRGIMILGTGTTETVLVEHLPPQD
jgi:hypothetical protein